MMVKVAWGADSVSVQPKGVEVEVRTQGLQVTQVLPEQS